MLFKRIGAVQILGLLLLGSTLSAQTPFLYSPEPVESNSLHFSAGLSLTILPQILVDGEGRLVPTLTARGRYGVSGGLSVEAGLRTNVLTTYVDLQGRYALDVDPLYFGGSLRTALWYGFAPIDGFNITALGWHISPAVEAGFTSGELRLSALLEIQALSFLTIDTRGVVSELSSIDDPRSYSLTLQAEQPFWNRQSLALGLTMHYTASNYQAWLAFSTFEERLIYPEFFCSLLF